ncbi:N-acetyltransferase [Candidatus Bathycorpusculum sp.]|uniref:GNAT family N-acetyltransferase n=1 Tax=Candidatus Bathycorpusculum sp. TaxID=2994959 RepID=UPI00281E244A|nr:N-acetyltransferase [Candidatus Termitimicrobium sp.]MCL2432584.1 N-acetyltransferase [Candidatus Termitimicrobium sp.]
MDIRTAQAEDFASIYGLVKIAFQTAEMPPANEEDYVLKWRANDNYVPELEFVAEEKGEIIGHIMLQKLIVHTNDDGNYMGLLVAPLCVKLEYRNQGVGGKLLYAGFEKAKEMGYTAAFLAGNPKYYNKFGFKEIDEFGIKNKTTIPNQFVLGCEIIKGSLENIKGFIDALV